MANFPDLLSRDDAIEQGAPWYGRIQEVYRDDGEFIGTKVSVVSVEDDGTVLSSTVERKYYRTNWGYNRSIRKDIEWAASWIGSVATRN